MSTSEFLDAEPAGERQTPLRFADVGRYKLYADVVLSSSDPAEHR